MDEKCKTMTRLDAVITVIDAKHIPQHLENHIMKFKSTAHKTSEIIQQITFADRIIINKMDLIRDHEFDALMNHIQSFNPNARIMSCEYGNIAIDELLNIQAFDGKTNQALLTPSQTNSFLQFDKNGKITKSQYRFNSIQSNQNDIIEDHMHIKYMTGGMMTVSLSCDQDLDLDRFNYWITETLRENGNNIYRLKGILSMHGYDQQFLAHGVHMMFDGELGPLWNHDTSLYRKSKLVLIGNDFDHYKLKNGFLACRQLETVSSH
jgi:G3E family GTPase